MLKIRPDKAFAIHNIHHVSSCIIQQTFSLLIFFLLSIPFKCLMLLCQLLTANKFDFIGEKTMKLKILFRIMSFLIQQQQQQKNRCIYSASSLMTTNTRLASLCKLWICNTIYLLFSYHLSDIIVLLFLFLLFFRKRFSVLFIFM